MALLRLEGTKADKAIERANGRTEIVRLDTTYLSSKSTFITNHMDISVTLHC